MSRLYDAIRALAIPGDRAAIGRVVGYRGNATYTVQLNGTDYHVPAAGDATAEDGQSVAVIVSGETGRPVAMLGVVRSRGVS